MTLQELIDSAKTLVLTDADKERIAKSLKELDKQFLAQEERMRPTAEMLNRLYTL